MTTGIVAVAIAVGVVSLATAAVVFVGVVFVDFEVRVARHFFAQLLTWEFG